MVIAEMCNEVRTLVHVNKRFTLVYKNFFGPT